MNPLPSREEALDYLLSLDLFEQTGNAEEGAGYARRHVDRFLRTLRFLPELDERARVLELGASPYFMTLLMKRRFGFLPTVANFFGDYAEEQRSRGRITVSSARHGESHELEYETFNVERDPFPYPDGGFDLVVCCEMLEHLAASPSFLVREVHRVLRPGGRFLLTTPNAKRLEQVGRLVRGDRNPYDPYSGYGVYGRHNREYMPWEVEELLRLHNFGIEAVEVDDAYPHELAHRLLTRLFPRRGDTIFALGRKEGATVERYPSWLYEHPRGALRVHSNRIVMGAGERDQLGPGWHELVHEPPAVRWTSRSAIAHLRPAGGEDRVLLRCRRGGEPTHGTLVVDGHPAGTFRLEAEGMQDVELALPGEALAAFAGGEVDYLTLEIRVEGAVRPSSPARGARETGPLGIAVERIELLGDGGGAR